MYTRTFYTIEKKEYYQEHKEHQKPTPDIIHYKQTPEKI